MSDILIAGQVYLIGFVIAMLMAALIKLLVYVIRRFSPDEKPAAANESEGGAS